MLFPGHGLPQFHGTQAYEINSSANADTDATVFGNAVAKRPLSAIGQDRSKPFSTPTQDVKSSSASRNNDADHSSAADSD